MGKHAFLIMAYDRWKQLALLLQLIDDERNDIYLHINANTKNVPFEQLKSCVKKSKIIFVDRIRVRWGTFDVFQATLNCLECAINNRGSYDYYHLLSGQDLPIRPMSYIHSFFDEHNGQNFINTYPVDQLPHEWRERVSLHNLCVGNFRGSNIGIKIISKIVNKTVLYIERLMKINRVRKYEKNGLIIAGGATWFSITDDFAKYVIEQKTLIYKVFKDYTWFADEMVLQTLLWSSEYKITLFDPTRIVEDGSGSLRFIDWERGKPYTWRSEDFEMLLNSNYLFARKFDENIDWAIIDKIYTDLIRRDTK